MRNNRNSGTRNTAINNLLSALIKTPKPKAEAELIVAPGKLQTFLGLTAALRKPDAVPTVSGKWLVCDSPFKWAEAQEQIAAVKAAGFKTAWVKGGRMGVKLSDLAA